MTNSDWPEVVVSTTPDNVALLEEWLFTAGAVSVSYQDKNDQPILEPEPGEMRLWDDIVLVGLFAQASNTDDLQSELYLSAAATGIALPEFQLRVLADAVWERAWMQDYQPMQFGPKLWVVPSHQEPPDPNATIVHLDPGMAFGTGTHPTTALCLSWLGNKTGTIDQPLQHATVVDYGCGSGVLAIAAAKLGATSVIAVDIDQQALIATRQNAADNGVLDRITVAHPDELSIANIDLVMANILYEPLTTLSDRFADALVGGGTLLMSGILQEQVAPLGISYNKWFDFEPATVSNGWALLTATRRPRRPI